MCKKSNFYFTGAGLGFAIIATAWAMRLARINSLLWGAFALFLSIIAIYIKDVSSFGAAIGLLMGFGIEMILRMVKSRPLKLAWIFVVFIAAALFFALVRGTDASYAMADFIDNMGQRSLFGMGFGTGQNVIFNGISYGLGMFGLGVCATTLFAGLYFAIFPYNQRPLALLPCFGLAGMIFADPNMISLNGTNILMLICVIFMNFITPEQRPKRKPLIP